MKKIILLLAVFYTPLLLKAQADSLVAKVYTLSELPVHKDSSRYRIQLMDGSTTWLTNLEVHLTILEPGKSAHLPHTHTHTEELLIVKEGTITRSIAGKTKILTPGAVAMAMTGDEHGAVNTGNANAAYYLLKYTKKENPDHERAAHAGGSILVNWNEVQVETTDRGLRRQQFNRATSLFDNFDMHATTLNKGEISHPPHTHAQEEIIIVRKGTIEMQLGNAFFKMGVGDLVFLPSNISHALKNTTDGQCEYFAFQWQ